MFILKYGILIVMFLIAIIFTINRNQKVRVIGLAITFLSLISYCVLLFGVETILNPVFIIFYITIAFGVFLFVYKKLRNIKFQKESYDDINYLNRDISTEYPPSIVGYLVNQNLGYRDLIADIIELYAKKIINISKVENQEERKIKFYLQDRDYANKINSQSQMYIINTLINDINGNQTFNFEKWKQLVLQEYKDRKFAKKRNADDSKKCIFIIILCMVILGGILGLVIGQGTDTVIYTTLFGIIIGGFLGTLIGFQYISFIKSSENTNVFLSKYGEEELKKWMKFKRFIKDYTLIEEKSVDEINIYESYIPYAIALGVNVKYKNKKFDIFDENELESIVNESDEVNFLRSMGISI